MSEHFCHQEDRIVKIERAVEGMTGQVQQIFNTVSGLEKQIGEALKKLDEQRDILYGGKDGNGLLSWKASAGDTIDELKLALKGYGKEPGLISVIENLSVKIGEWSDDRKWLIRLIIGNIVVIILGLIFVVGK